MALSLDQNGLSACSSLPDLRNMVPRATDKMITSESELINSCLSEEVLKNEEEPLDTVLIRTRSKDKKEIDLIERLLQSILCQILSLGSAEIEDSNLEGAFLQVPATRPNEWWVNTLNTILSRIDLLSERLRLIMEEAERSASFSNIAIFTRQLLSGTVDFAKDLWEYLWLLPVHFKTRLLSVPQPLTL